MEETFIKDKSVWKPKVLLFFKAFLYFAIGFGVLSIILQILISEELDIITTAFVAFSSGLFFSWIVVYTYSSNLRSIGQDQILQEDLKSIHHLSIESQLPLEELYQRLMEGMQTKSWKFELKDNAILASAGWKLYSYSWGEKMKIERRGTHYFVESKTKFWFNIFDGAANKINLYHIRNVIEEANKEKQVEALSNG